MIAKFYLVNLRSLSMVIYLNFYGLLPNIYIHSRMSNSTLNTEKKHFKLLRNIFTKFFKARRKTPRGIFPIIELVPVAKT